MWPASEDPSQPAPPGVKDYLMEKINTLYKLALSDWKENGTNNIYGKFHYCLFIYLFILFYLFIIIIFFFYLGHL